VSDTRRKHCITLTGPGPPPQLVARENDYQQALWAVGGVLEPYDADGAN
jgi:hypothetical protein